jgi:hypothetical protein
MTYVYNFEYPIYNITTVRVDGINVFFIDDHHFAYSCSKLKIISREISPGYVDVFQVEDKLYVCCMKNGLSYLDPKTIKMTTLDDKYIKLIQGENIVKMQNENDITILSKHTQDIFEKELDYFVHPVIAKIILQYLCYLNEEVGVKKHIEHNVSK